MANINLREFYPSIYTTDCFMEVSDEVAGALAEEKRLEHNYIEKIRYHKAYYSLDIGDGIENDALYFVASPEELYEDKLTREQLCAALANLSESQRRRIEARFIHGMSVADIALAEGVGKSRVSDSINRGLHNMKTFLKNF